MDYAPAPFWRRLVARTLDLAIALPLTLVAVLPVVLLTFPLSFLLSDDQYGQFGAFLCFLVAYTLIEYVRLRRRSGQTVGKGLLGLRVLEVHRGLVPLAHGQAPINPDEISTRAALGRMAILIGPAMAFVGAFYVFYDETVDDAGNGLADAFFYLWLALLAGSAVLALLDRRRHRGLHDLAGRTQVVRAARRGINLRVDAMMLLPGRVGLEERSPSKPILLSKQ